MELSTDFVSASMMISALVCILVHVSMVAAESLVVQLTNNASVSEFAKNYSVKINWAPSARSSRYGSDVVEALEFGENFKVISGNFSGEILMRLYNDKKVASISIDRRLELQEYVVQGHSSSHLSSLSSGSGPSYQPFVLHPNSGFGVDMYVFDTGIDSKHPSLRNINVRKLVDLTSSPVPQGSDPHGHGTSMAGLIASETFGVLRKCSLIDVRVAGNAGKVKLSQLLKALSISLLHTTKTKRPSVFVIPMIMKSNSRILNNALEAVSDAIPIVVPAGNQHSPACNWGSSNGGMRRKLLVIGSVDNENNLATFSNYGDCVDLFAAGIDVTTLASSDNREAALIRKINGTSSSCAIGAGVVGYYMSMGFNSTESIEKVKNISRDITGNSHHIKLLQLKPWENTARSK